ncbi:TPA: hypothetical protein ACRTM4_003555 [Aeromonas hydrophila]|nr:MULTISPECIES: hypothetical protein [Aeromonas]APJ16773.1 hypothetical protein BOQ57_18605 [Aeromonas hydrophila]MCK0186683.1 hypothetical protein [Aeromonas hydrophila]MDX7901190.1 hypothetical protein [Aeromonas media]UCM58306.1 hypothetical protein LEO74_03790 [Aeromonas hydrophila]UOV92815.1 hypothetical protein MUW98_04070 [Aeromonas hydrophila]
MKIYSIIKVIGAGLATILLGAIGSGVWEKLLSPGLKNLSEFTTKSLSSISQTYSDSIYSKASSIENYNQPDVGGILLLIIIFVWILFHALSSKTDNTVVRILHRAMTNQFKGWDGILFSSAFLVLIFFLMATNTTVSEIKKYSVKNMEIVRPYIGESSYLMLRSNYLQMKNEDDFNGFLSEIYAIAKAKKIDIDEFSQD